MSLKDRPKPAESDAPTVAPWMVTFSDCMTLLLCFFVMLLSYSSFDETLRQRLGGLFPRMSRDSIFSHRWSISDAFLPRIEIAFDYTKEGSERPTPVEMKKIENPAPMPEPLDKEAYRDRKVISIASSKLFYAKGSSMTWRGRRLLRLIASFMRRLPCQVIIGETTADFEPAGSRRDDSGPADSISSDRAWAVMRYFTETQGLSREQFSISSASPVSAERPIGEPVVNIVLLLRGLHK